MAKAPVEDAPASCKGAPSAYCSAQQNAEDVTPRALTVPTPKTADAASNSEASKHQDPGRPIGFFEPFEKNGVRRVVYYDPGTELLSLQDSLSAPLISSPRALKRAHQDDISQTGELSSSTTGPNNVKRRETPTSKRAARRTRSAPKPRSRGRSRATRQFNGDNGDDDEEDEENSIAVLTMATNELYVGDCAGMASFYKARLGEINQTFLKQIVTKWLHVLEPSRQRKYGAYVPKKTPKDLEPGTCPPWWPSTTPYVEPSHLGKDYIMPMAVDLMQIHRRSDKHKRTAFPSWIEEMKKHVDYIISTCPSKVFSSSNSSTFVDAMKETTIKVMNDMFSVAQSHEDHLIQNYLFEEMGNEDDGRGKRLTWSAMPKPRRPLSKSKAASRSEGSEDEIEVDDSHMELVQDRRSSTQPTPQSLRQTPTTPNDVVMTAPVHSMSPPASQRPDAYHMTLVCPSPHMSDTPRALPLPPSSRTPTSSLDYTMNRYIPAVEARRNSEPYGQVIHEPQSYYNPSSYNAFELAAMDRAVSTYPSQSQVHFSPVSEPELTGYQFQNHPTTMSTPAPMYSTQPSYTTMFVPDNSYLSYPPGLPQNIQGYADIPPVSSMDNKRAMDCNSSLGPMCLDVDMTPPEMHGLPQVSGNHLRFPRIPYCDCQGQLCMCSGQGPQSRR